jgi:hypothetical protein
VRADCWPAVCTGQGAVDPRVYFGQSVPVGTGWCRQRREVVTARSGRLVTSSSATLYPPAADSAISWIPLPSMIAMIDGTPNQCATNQQGHFTMTWSKIMAQNTMPRDAFRGEGLIPNTLLRSPRGPPKILRKRESYVSVKLAMPTVGRS